MTEDEIRAIVREEIEKIGGLDIGEVIALHVRQVTVNALRNIGAEEFMQSWAKAGKGNGH